MARSLLLITEPNGDRRVIIFHLLGKLRPATKTKPPAFDAIIRRYSGSVSDYRDGGAKSLRCSTVITCEVTTSSDLSAVGCHYQSYVNTMLRRRNGSIVEQDDASRLIMEHRWESSTGPLRQA